MSATDNTRTVLKSHSRNTVIVVIICLVLWSIPALFILPAAGLSGTSLLLAELFWLAATWAGLVSSLNAIRVELRPDAIVQRRIRRTVTIHWQGAVACREGLLIVISNGRDTIKFNPLVFPDRTAMYAFLREHLPDRGDRAGRISREAHVTDPKPWSLFREQVALVTAFISGLGLMFMGPLRANMTWLVVWGAITILLARRSSWLRLALAAVASGGLWGLMMILGDYLDFLLDGKPLHRTHSEWLLRGAVYSLVLGAAWFTWSVKSARMAKVQSELR